MAQQDIFEIFEDCTQRLASGQSIEDCLGAYPQYTGRLRPMLETAQAARTIKIPSDEILEDQALVWQAIEAQLPLRMPNRPHRRLSLRVQLLVAIILLLLLTTMSWLILSRPDLPEDRDLIVPIVETMTYTPTITETPEPSLSPTATQTTTPTMTSTQTLTMTATATAITIYTRTPIPTQTASVTASMTLTLTITPTASYTSLPTATYAPGCGAPLTEEDAIALVLSIYPNTTITSIKQVIRFNNTLVWEIITSHGIEITIDVACGNILTIERTTAIEDNLITATDVNTNVDGSDNTGTSSQNNATTSNKNGDVGDDNSNSNSNDNNSNDDGGNSGMGSGDDD